MRTGLRWLAGVGAISVLTACGTSLPNRDFSVLGSGNPVVQQSTGGGTDGTGTGTGSGGSGTGSGGSSVGSGGASTGAGGAGGGTGSGGSGNGSGGSGGSGKGTGSSSSTKANGHTGKSVVPTGSCGSGNSASDTGVTGTTIKIGTIYSGAGNPFAPDQFIPNYYGLEAYVAHLNQGGGICGRQVQLVHCDDNGDRNQDIACAHTLIDQDKVFALVSNNVYQYSAAQYVSQSKTPDVGGEPVTGNSYYTYPGLFSIEGSYYPNNGNAPSKYYSNYGLGQYFKQKLHLTRAGVISYAQTDSQRGGDLLAGFLKSAGVKVDTESVPLAGDPTPQVQDMKSNHDQAIFDSLDLSGNAKVCGAMKSLNYNVPKVSTISMWTREDGKNLASYPCLNDYYSWGFSTAYTDTQNKAVATFRQAFATYAPGVPLAEWSFEGWIGGMWFANAAASCGAKLTRVCLENAVNTKKGYSAGGLIDPNTLSFPRFTSEPSRLTQCDTIVKWAGGKGGDWQNVIDHNQNCHTTGTYTYGTGG